MESKKPETRVAIIRWTNGISNPYQSSSNYSGFTHCRFVKNEHGGPHPADLKVKKPVGNGCSSRHQPFSDQEGRLKQVLVERFYETYLPRNYAKSGRYTFFRVEAAKGYSELWHSGDHPFNPKLLLLYLVAIDHGVIRVAADRTTAHQGRNKAKMCLIFLRPAGTVSETEVR